MRILVIRGKNLASLYGDFELPLDQSPIAEAGLFSISGPTGSGKSTLMDALCLALYGETPRFDERGKGVQPGRADDDPAVLVDANDKRNLLSRGTGDGFAEVDFEAMDGFRYRARWEVRRARGKADGRFQNVQMKLEALDGNGAWSGVEEVRKRVQALVGYSFAEFRRAVVLPQFEFRAFLDADTDTRARILERVTGTELYAQLSKKAHERAATEKAALAQLQLRAGDLAVLAPEERAAAEETGRALEERRARARKEKDAAEGDVRWHAEEARLASDVGDADGAVERAIGTAVAAAPRRRELADVEGAQPLRPARDAATRTAAEHAAATAKQTVAAGVHGEAERSLAVAVDAHTAAEKALASSLAQTEALRPELEKARALDARIGELEPRAARAEQAAAAARADVTEKQTRLAALDTKLLEAEHVRRAADEWLAAREGERALASDWPRWKKRLEEHARLVADLRRGEDSLASLRAALGSATSRRDELGAAVEMQQAAFSAAEAGANAAAERAARLDLAALASRLNSLGARREELAKLLTIAQEASAAARAHDAAAVEAEAARAAHERLGSRKQELEREVAAAEGRVAAAREALARIEAALNLEEHRAELVDGEACPLCGATEHPYAKDAPAESARKAQSAAVKGGEAALKKLRGEVERCAAELAAAGEKSRGSSDAAVRHAAALADASARYDAAAASVGEEVPGAALGAGEALAALLEEATAALAVAQAEQVEALSRSREAAAARASLERARAALDEVRRKLATAQVDCERSLGDAKAREEEVRGLAVRRDGLEAELEPVLAFRPGWREQARATPEALAKACGALVEAHGERERALREAAELLAALRPQREIAATSLGERIAGAASAEAAARDERTTLAAVRSERQALLAGRDAAEVERARADAERAARKTLDEAVKRLQAGGLRLAAAEASLAEATAAVTAAERAAGGAAAALASELAARGIDRARLDALLARDAERIAAEREALAGLDAAVRDEQAKLAERKRRLEAHGAHRPATTPEEARTLVEGAAQAEEEAFRGLTEVQARLRQDDDNRVARSALDGDIAKQTAATERWAALSALIGAHDGRELRVFAQGLTLDALLRAANHHLESLAPRYLLQRVPRRDLDIQVLDGDLGNEVRGVNGLSGGESFLVSLALALGLSSLSTRRTQAKTLFIDEGFGTLDRDTLEQAMAAIDQLRAGQRTVGIISHVPELHERIGVKVEVERVSAGRSRLVLPDGMAARQGDTAPSRRTAS